jgi:hypothetical protein
MNWTTPADIRAQLQRLWDDQSLLADVTDEVASATSDVSYRQSQARSRDPLISFPLTLRFRKPAPRELATSYEQARDWIKSLEAGSRAALGFGYDIVWEETNHRVIGRNASPAAVVVATRSDALALIAKDEASAQFTHLVRRTLELFPELVDWLRRKPLKLVEEATHWERVLGVLSWFRAHPKSGRYIRQVDVAGADTKFIERRKALLAELLDIVLPPGAVEQTHTGLSHFEARYGLAAKPSLIRFRILDPALALSGLTDLTVRADEFSQLSIGATRVFVVENEINGLAFPAVPGGLVIFGLGYSIDLIRPAEWLGRRHLHYWGDLDTHGFAMLDRMREAFPDALSLLMDRSTLVANKALWGIEDAPHIAPLTRLTTAEAAVFDDLRFDRLGRGVRLEQERIPFGAVIAAIASVAGAYPHE